MPYKNPLDKKAWRKAYLPKQRECTRAWKKKQSELKRPERAARAAAFEKKENARVLPIVIRQLKREAMFREGLASCSYCKAVLPRAEVRIPKNDPRKQERHKAFHYTNLQPLWAADNMKKGGRIIPKAFQPNLLYPLVGSLLDVGGFA